MQQQQEKEEQQVFCVRISRNMISRYIVSKTIRVLVHCEIAIFSAKIINSLHCLMAQAKKLSRPTFSQIWLLQKYFMLLWNV